MAEKDKIVQFSEQINKKDLETILEVNRKAVEIETAVADQNEEIIDQLNDAQKKQEEIDKKLDKVITLSEHTSKDIFRIQVLFVTGLMSLIIQIISMFLKK